MPRVRSSQIGLLVSSVSYSSILLAEAVQHHRQRAQLQAGGGQPDEVGGDPVELHHQHPQRLGARRRLDAEQLLHRQAVGGLVEDRREVVHPRHEGDALDPGAVLDRLLDAGVEVADDRLAGDHLLAAELDHQPQHAVGGRVLRADVDDHDVVLALGVGARGDLGPVATAHGQHLLGALLVEGDPLGGRCRRQVVGLAGGDGRLLDELALGRPVALRGFLLGAVQLAHVLVHPPR
jgi:hypothetical protein